MDINTDMKASYIERLAKQWMLKESFTGNLGLLSGKTGLAIFFFRYARYSKNELYETFAGDLIDEVFEEINARTPLNFKDGLCGIGWGVDYLIRNNFLEGDIDEILEDLDKIIFSYDTAVCDDTSFETGSEGIEFYRSFRKGLNGDHSFELTVTFDNEVILTF